MTDLKIDDCFLCGRRAYAAYIACAKHDGHIHPFCDPCFSLFRQITPATDPVGIFDSGLRLKNCLTKELLTAAILSMGK